MIQTPRNDGERERETWRGMGLFFFVSHCPDIDVSKYM